MGLVLMLHSLVRFVLLLVAVAGIVKSLVNLTQRSEPTPLDRMIASAFLGIYDLQILLGLLIILLGGLTNAFHPVIMFTGAVLAHGLQAMSRRTQGANVHLVRLAFYIIPLVIILVGLAVIGRLPA